MYYTYFTSLMRAKKIGSLIAVRAALVGITIAYLLIAVLLGLDEGITAILWVFNFEYRPNLLLGATGLVVMAYFFGQRAGIEIIKQKNILIGED